MPTPRRSAPVVASFDPPHAHILPVGDCRVMTRFAAALQASAPAGGVAFWPCCTGVQAAEDALRVGQSGAVLLQAGCGIWSPALHQLRREGGVPLALLAVFAADAQAEAKAVGASAVLDVNEPLEVLGEQLAALLRR